MAPVDVDSVSLDASVRVEDPPSCSGEAGVDDLPDPPTFIGDVALAAVDRLKEVHDSTKPSAVAKTNNPMKRITKRAAKKSKHIVMNLTTSVQPQPGNSLADSTSSSELMLLKAELARLQQESKVFKSNVQKEFKGVKSHTASTVTHFGFYWMITVACLTMAALYAYVIVRAIRGSTTTFYALYVYSAYCGVYVVMFLLDVFWTTIRPDRVRCERNTRNTHVMVAAHRADESLAIMLPKVLQSFHGCTVWVCDNGFYDGGRTRDLCERLGVHYRYNKVGNKANALLATGREIERDYPDVQNVVLLDDDTDMPSDFFIRHDLLAKDRVAGYCVGIGVKRSPRFNLLEVAIDYEYRQISHSYGARAASSTSWFLHGICAVYRLDRFFDIFEDNWSMPGGLPFGEDGYAGVTARMKGYRLLQDNHNMVHTFCPDQFLPPCGKGGRVQGYGASSLWKQRACRWYLSWPRAFSSEIHLFFTYKAGSLFGNIQYRIYVLWRIFLDFVGVIWIPFFFYILFKDGSWDLYFLLKGMLISTSIISTTCRILVFPPKLRKGIHPMAPFVTPVFTLGNDFLRFCSFFICMYWFIPFVRIGELKFYENCDPTDVEGDEDEFDFGTASNNSKSVTSRGSDSISFSGSISEQGCSQSSYHTADSVVARVAI